MFSQPKSKTIAKPHYTFYMDLNGTIIASDAANGKDTDDALWQLLCENIHSTWPKSGSMNISYRKYIEKYLCPDDTNKSPTQLKAERKECYKEIAAHLKANQHPLANQITYQFNILKKIMIDKNTYLDKEKKSRQGTIVPSFIKLIEFLEQEKFDYSIVLSTFGTDAAHVIKELEERTTLQFPKDTEVRFQAGKLMTASGEISDPYLMHEFFKQKCVSVQHDWKHWNSHGEQCAYGKPFPIDLESDMKNQDVSIFFDDNLIDKQIINIRALSGKPFDTTATQDHLIASKKLIPANLYEAIIDDNYFIRIALFHQARLIKLANQSAEAALNKSLEFSTKRHKKSSLRTHGIFEIMSTSRAELYCPEGEKLPDQLSLVNPKKHNRFGLT
jgi:hypothetical protein